MLEISAVVRLIAPLAHAAAASRRAGLLVFDVALPRLCPSCREWRRLWARRFNQSAALAGAIAKRSGLPIAHDALKRIKATAQQVGLSAAERLANVQSAFRVPHEGKPEVAGHRLVLVDDVLTSGATVDSCARALLRPAPCRCMYCLCLGCRSYAQPGTKTPAQDAAGTKMALIEIYTTPLCPYCSEAKALLARKGVAFTEINVLGNQQRRREMTERTKGRTTVPQIFIGASHVGGCHELCALDEVGGLDPMLSGESEPA